MKKTLIIILAAAMLLCAGCTGKVASPAPSPAPSEVPSEVSAAPSPSPSPSPEVTQGTIRTSELDGVYKNTNGMFVIRNVQVGACSFIAEVGDGYLSGTMERDDYTLTYWVNNFLLTAVIDGKKLTVTVAEPYAQSVFAGTYEKTSEDPYSISVDDTRTTNTSAMPDSVKETVIDGESVSVYMDPAGRFTAIFPSLFYAAYPEKMPPDGICLVGEAGTVFLTVSAQPQDVPLDAASLKAQLEKDLPSSTVELREDGSVLCIRTLNDPETTEMALYFPGKTEIYEIAYQYPTAEAEYYGAKGQCMQFNFS